MNCYYSISGAYFMITTRGAEPENEALDGSVCMLPLFGELQEISLSIV